MKIIISILLLLSTTIGRSQSDSLKFAKYLSKFSSDTGGYLPKITLYDKTGESKKIEDFKGKIIYLHIWDVDCNASLKAFPYEQQLLIRLKAINLDSSIEIINICTSSSEEQWKQILNKENPVGINLYCRDTSLFRMWQVKRWPNFMLLDRSGKVLGKSISSPHEIITTDYILYAATKGIDPVQAAWTNFFQTKLLFEQRNILILDQDYREWYLSMGKPLMDYENWRQEYEKKKSR